MQINSPIQAMFAVNLTTFKGSLKPNKKETLSIIDSLIDCCTFQPELDIIQPFIDEYNLAASDLRWNNKAQNVILHDALMSRIREACKAKLKAIFATPESFKEGFKHATKVTYLNIVEIKHFVESHASTLNQGWHEQLVLASDRFYEKSDYLFTVDEYLDSVITQDPSIETIEWADLTIDQRKQRGNMVDFAIDSYDGHFDEMLLDPTITSDQIVTAIIGSGKPCVVEDVLHTFKNGIYALNGNPVSKEVFTHTLNEWRKYGLKAKEPSIKSTIDKSVGVYKKAKEISKVLGVK